MEDKDRPFPYAEDRAYQYATPWRTGHEEEDAKEARRICKICCRWFSGLLAAFFIIFIIHIVLMVTVFKVKDPTISLDSIIFDNISINNSFLPNSPAKVNSSIKATVTADLSIKNPNIAYFKFNQGTTVLNYYGFQIGKAENPAGNAEAMKTMKMNLIIDIYVQADSSSPGKLQHLRSDLSSGKMTIDTYTVLDGSVKVIYMFKKFMEIKMNCTMAVAISSTITLEDMRCTSSDVKVV